MSWRRWEEEDESGMEWVMAAVVIAVVAAVMFGRIQNIFFLGGR